MELKSKVYHADKHCCHDDFEGGDVDVVKTADVKLCEDVNTHSLWKIVSITGNSDEIVLFYTEEEWTYLDPYEER